MRRFVFKISNSLPRFRDANAPGACETFPLNNEGSGAPRGAINIRAGC